MFLYDFYCIFLAQFCCFFFIYLHLHFAFIYFSIHRMRASRSWTPFSILRLLCCIEAAFKFTKAKFLVACLRCFAAVCMYVCKCVLFVRKMSNRLQYLSLENNLEQKRENSELVLPVFIDPSSVFMNQRLYTQEIDTLFPREGNVIST